MTIIRNRRSLISLLALIFVLLATLTLLGSWYVVKRFTSRRNYHSQWYTKTEQYKAELCTRYQGKPVIIPTTDGLKLSGLFFVRPNAQRVFLICHGYWMNKERMRSLVRLFDKDSLLLFDYRAHGESEGTFTSIGFYEQEDVKAAASFLQQHPDTAHLPLYGIGVSMGAATLLAAAAQGIPFKGLVVDSLFDRLDMQLKKSFASRTGFPSFPFWPICQALFEYMGNYSMAKVDALSWARTIHIPTLVIHTEADVLVEPAIAQQIYEALQGPKELWIMDGSQGANHATIFKRHAPEYAQRIDSFFLKHQ
jgi:pimeloyl-ACP methyl ester carboxylesterase